MLRARGAHIASTTGAAKRQLWRARLLPPQLCAAIFGDLFMGNVNDYTCILLRAKTACNKEVVGFIVCGLAHFSAAKIDLSLRALICY